MMDRSQRMNVEILDCALYRATRREGYTTNVAEFVGRLRKLFPDIEAFEFRQACKRLVAERALDLRLLNSGVQRSYEGPEDDVFFDDRALLRLGGAALSHDHFQRLSALIEAPPGMRQPGRR